MILGKPSASRKPLPRTITYPFLSVEKCNEIIESSTGWIEGTVFKFGQFITAKEHRSVLLSKSGISEELEDNIFRSIFKTNADTFRYHLDGLYSKDPILVFKYSADRSDHYIWHTDLIQDTYIRKLSFSIQLTDPAEYDGGDLEFIPFIKDDNIRKQGHITIFPSFCTHRVTPVTRGIRHVIVGWVYGPEFR
jgi:predicted 2-oxoglutarate/Fe(II)-dependent dioxygenase YbiX